MRFSKRAQSAIEYALLAAVVGLAAATMFHYCNRTVQGKLKAIESQVNLALEYEEADQ